MPTVAGRMQRSVCGMRPAASSVARTARGAPRAADGGQPAPGRPAPACVRGRRATSSGAERGAAQAARLSLIHI
eukprot:6138673-Alexandrium_andersonii.AAC.1